MRAGAGEGGGQKKFLYDVSSNSWPHPAFKNSLKSRFLKLQTCRSKMRKTVRCNFNELLLLLHGGGVSSFKLAICNHFLSDSVEI